MPGAQPRRAPAAKVASGVARGTAVKGPGAVRVVRATQSNPEASGDWVVIEPESDIAAKSHPYISFDPAGSL